MASQQLIIALPVEERNGGDSNANQNAAEDSAAGLQLARFDSSGNLAEGGEAAQFGAGDMVSPAELDGERREAYLAALWDQFGKRATKGFITVADGEDIALQMNIEGAMQRFGEEALAFCNEEGLLTFEGLTGLFDQLSSVSMGDTQDVDMQGVNADEILLTPLQYIKHKLPCTRTLESNAKVRLDPSYSIDITPKVSLLLTTSVLMIVIGVALVLLVSLLWISNAMAAEREILANLKATVFSLGTAFEVSFGREHQSELMDQTDLFADIANTLHLYDAEDASVWQLRAARLALMGWTGETAAQIATVPSLAKVGVLQQLMQTLNTLTPLTASGVQQYLFGDSNSTPSVRSLNFSSPAATYTALNVSSNPCDVAHGELLVIVPGSVNNAYCIGPADPANPDGDFFSFMASLDVLSMINGTFFAGRATGFQAAAVPNGTQNASRVVTAVELVGVDQLCADEDHNDLCVGLKAMLAAMPDNTFTLAENNVSLGAQPGLISVIRSGDSFVGVSQPAALFLANAQARMKDSVEHLNWQFVRSTEISLGRADPVTTVFNPQITSFRFADQCISTCFREGPAAKNMLNCFLTKQDQQGITPDYRPEPCYGASRWMADLQMVVTLERDTLEVRTMGLMSFITIVNTINAGLVGGTEIEVFRLMGMPPMVPFYANEPCPPNEDCETLPLPIGRYFMYSCQHCMRLPQRLPANDSIEFLTTRHFNATTLVPNQIYRDVLNLQVPLSGQVFDYSGREVLIELDFLHNYSVGFSVKIPVDEASRDVYTNVYIFIGVSAAILSVGLVVLVVLSGHALNAIEDTWNKMKSTIEADRARFAEVVSDIIPPASAAKMMKGGTLLAESANVIVVAFADICGFSDLTKSMPPRHIVRLASFVFVALEAVMDECLLNRLNTIGDCFGVYGEHTVKTKGNPELHPAMRGGRFGVIATMLFSGLFTHYPEKVRHFRDAFKERLRETAPFKLPTIRVGAHCGGMCAGLVDTGRAPRFDIFGQTPSLASRMAATATSLNTHVTCMMRDVIAMQERELDTSIFTFDDPRKTIVRGQGTITSYFVKSTTYDVPDAVLLKLSAQRANVVFNFEQQRLRRGGGDSEGGSVDHASSLSSRDLDRRSAQ